MPLAARAAARVAAARPARTPLDLMSLESINRRGPIRAAFEKAPT